MDKKEKLKKFKSIAKIFALLYLISFIVFNWNDISWIFNYREVYGLVDDFFNPYPETLASGENNFYPNQTAVKQNAATVKFVYSDKNNILEIPKIGISVPVIFSQSTDPSLVLKDLNKGVVYYPGSALPGQAGQTVILGHSAPPNWPKIKNDWVFSDLDNLTLGDQIFLYVDYKKYTYTVKQKNIIKRGQEITPLSLAQNGNYLALVSCWPPGKDLQRITVQAEIES